MTVRVSKKADPKDIHVWSGHGFKFSDMEISFAERYLEHLVDSDKILDIGAGKGKLVNFLIERGYEAVGIDLNEESVSEARAVNIPVKQMDALEAVLDEGKDFTVFSMLDFVEHIPIDVLFDILQSISEKPGAQVWIQTPNLESIMGMTFWFQVPTHITPLHPTVLKNILRRYNFDIVAEWTDYGGLPWKGFRRWIALKILNAILGSPMANLFIGGANICLVAKVKAGVN